MIKVLLVDDETHTRNGLLKHIPWKELGISSVRDARDGMDALEMCRDSLPDILVSDIRMPGMDGIELASRVQEMHPSCIIIFLSGYADKEYLKSAINLKALSYVEKPINIHEISSTLKKAVELYHVNVQKRSDEEKISKVLSGTQLYVKQKAVLGLISKKTDTESLRDELALMGLSFDFSRHFISVIVKLDWLDEVMPADDNEFPWQVLRHWEQMLDPIPNITACKDQNHIISILSQNNVNETEKLPGLLADLLSELQAHYGDLCNFSIAAGKKGFSFKGIYESYQTAVFTLQKLFFHGYGNIHYHDHKIQKEFQFLDSIEELYREKLQEQNMDNALQFLDKLCRDIQRNDATMVNNVKNLYFNLAVILEGEFAKRGISSRDSETEGYLWDLISNFKTIFEVRDYMADKTRILLQHVKEMDFSNRKIYDVTAFIQKNHANSSLTLQSISEAVYLTPTYLCAFFKKETGKTVNEYLTQVRIEKSKQLLCQKNIKLSDVAGKVGYNDANYYSKTFKKLVGVTPSEYRERFPC